MRVLMLVTRLTVGGTETYILSLARALKSYGVRVEIATLGGPLIAVCRKYGIPVHIVSNKKSLPGASVSSIVSRGNYRIIHANDTQSFNWVSNLNGGKHRIVLTLHGTYHGRNQLRSAAKKARRVIAVSQRLSVWAQQQGVAPGKIVRLPNGVDTSQFQPMLEQIRWKNNLNLPLGTQIIAYAGRFKAPKHLVAQKVILASARIAGKHRSAITVLAGPGRYLPALQKLAAGVNRRVGRKAVIVRPAILQIRQLYWSSDVVVGTGRVALEAMACGKPVIAAGTAGYVGPVTPGNIAKAIQCHFGDHSAPRKTTADQLARDISVLLQNKRAARSLGRFGRQVVTNRFSIRQIARHLKNLYARIQ